MVVGQLYPTGACGGTQELIVVFLLLLGGKWLVLGGLEVSVGTVSSVFGLTQLTADNTDGNDDACTPKMVLMRRFTAAPP
eukprot:9695940-Ditylum_brightwellii.AAC.1